MYMYYKEPTCDTNRSWWMYLIIAAPALVSGAIAAVIMQKGTCIFLYFILVDSL